MRLRLNVFIATDHMENTIIVERVYLDDKQLRPQTIRHHLERYQFACGFGGSGLALDLACGSGYGTEMLRGGGYIAVGMDIDPDAIKFAQTHYSLSTFYVADISKISSIGWKANLITFFEAIEHLSYKAGKKLIKTIQKKLLADGGMLILSTPRENNVKYNTFHKSEWSYDLLKNELGSVFDSVTIYGQDWDTAEISLDHVKENDFYICVCKQYNGECQESVEVEEGEKYPNL